MLAIVAIIWLSSCEAQSTTDADSNVLKVSTAGQT